MNPELLNAPSFPSEPERPVEPASKKGVNPFIAIMVAVVVALTLAGISLLVFLRSDTREQVNITEQAESTAADSQLSESPDETSNLSEENLSSIESKISGTANDVNSDEFGSSELTDASLGL